MGNFHWPDVALPNHFHFSTPIFVSRSHTDVTMSSWTVPYRGGQQRSAGGTAATPTPSRRELSPRGSNANHENTHTSSMPSPRYMSPRGTNGNHANTHTSPTRSPRYLSPRATNTNHTNTQTSPTRSPCYISPRGTNTKHEDKCGKPGMLLYPLCWGFVWLLVFQHP